jgi:hypothetical protein
MCLNFYMEVLLVIVTEYQFVNEINGFCRWLAGKRQEWFIGIVLRHHNKKRRNLRCFCSVVCAGRVGEKNVDK